MPIEDLLRMYGYANSANANQEIQESRSSSEAEILSNQDLTLDKEEVARDLLKDGDDSENETTERDLLDSVDFPSQTARLLRCKFWLMTLNNVKSFALKELVLKKQTFSFQLRNKKKLKARMMMILQTLIINPLKYQTGKRCGFVCQE